jgi:hypothetical protein
MVSAVPKTERDGARHVLKRRVHLDIDARDLVAKVIREATNKGLEELPLLLPILAHDGSQKGARRLREPDFAKVLLVTNSKSATNLTHAEAPYLIIRDRVPQKCLQVLTVSGNELKVDHQNSRTRKC